MWFVSGLAAAAAARLVRFGRPPGRLVEAAIAVSAALLAGLIATAFDFGGWREADWRAGVFSFLIAAACVGGYRLARLYEELR